MATNAGEAYVDPVRYVLNIWYDTFVPWVKRGEWGDAQNPQLADDETTWCSIADAEALECLLLPQFLSPRLSLAEPGRLDLEVARILNDLNEDNEVDDTESSSLDRGAQLAIIGHLTSFFRRHSQAGEGTLPVFRSGPYFLTSSDSPALAAEDLHATVDDFTMSLSLSVHAAHLFSRWSEELSGRERDSVEGQRLKEATALAQTRLGAAMLGLLRSFAVKSVPNWKDTVGGDFPKGRSSPVSEVRRRLRTILPGYDAALKSPEFECGFSWGQTRIGDFDEELSAARQSLFGSDNPLPVSEDGAAQSAPYLYFTVTALEGIADLQSHAARRTGLLTGALPALSARLTQLAEISSTFWTEIALGDDPRRWTIEDMPWTTSDGSESDYWTLCLLSIITTGTSLDRFRDDVSIERLLLILEELAQRTRVTRRPHPSQDDVAVLLHVPPGQRIDLWTENAAGSASPSDWYWSTYDFGPKLLKLAARVYGLAQARRLRERAEELVNAIWYWHIDYRRLSRERHIWDNPKNIPSFDEIDWDKLEGGTPWSAPTDERYSVGSWYITERVLEGLTELITARGSRSFSSRQTRELAFEIAAEGRYARSTSVTEDSELGQQIDHLLNRARQMLDEYPGASLAHALEANRLISDAAEGRKR